MKKLIFVAVVIFMGCCVLENTPELTKYNVMRNSPSLDASGQMPLGNGDIAAGVYAIENGDFFLLYSKSDGFTNELLKIEIC